LERDDKIKPEVLIYSVYIKENNDFLQLNAIKQDKNFTFSSNKKEVIHKEDKELISEEELTNESQAEIVIDSLSGFTCSQIEKAEKNNDSVTESKTVLEKLKEVASVSSTKDTKEGSSISDNIKNTNTGTREPDKKINNGLGKVSTDIGILVKEIKEEKVSKNEEKVEEIKGDIWKLPLSQWPKPKCTLKICNNPPVIEVKANKPLNSMVNENNPSNAPKLFPIKKNGALFKFVTGYAMKSKDKEQGEDACFACERVLGVADGVSGWKTYGIDSSAFSKKLMTQCEIEVRQQTNLAQTQAITSKKSLIPKAESYIGLDFQANTIYTTKKIESNTSEYDKKVFEKTVDPLRILSVAYEKVADIGSSTATVIALNRTKIEAVNLGDSGFLHFSLKNGQYEVKNESKEQQHEFNVPYQLSRLPGSTYFAEMKLKGLVKEARKLERILEGNKICKDNPEAADKYEYEVADGDIIVVGTDGLFDNLSPTEIKKIINTSMVNVRRIVPRVSKEIADRLVAAAYRKSKLPIVSTPFKKKYKEMENELWEQGKEDDITAVIGVIKPFNY